MDPSLAFWYAIHSARPRAAIPWLQFGKEVGLLQQGRYVLPATLSTAPCWAGSSAMSRSLERRAPPLMLPAGHPPVLAYLPAMLASPDIVPLSRMGFLLTRPNAQKRLRTKKELFRSIL